MKKPIILILLPLLFATELLGQGESKNAISLSWGIGNLVKQALTFTPLIHRDWSPVNFLLTYKRSNKLEHQASIRFGNYKSRIGDEFVFRAPWDKESFPTYPHSFNVGGINYSLGKSILKSDQLKLALGGRSRNRVDITDYVFGFSGTAGNYLSFELDIWIDAQREISEKHRMAANIGLPVFAYVYRSPHLTQNDDYFEDIYSHDDLKGFLLYLKRGEIQSWNKSQNFDFDITYYYALSGKWELGAIYWFSINLNQKPAKYAAVENVVCLSANSKF